MPNNRMEITPPSRLSKSSSMRNGTEIIFPARLNETESVGIVPQGVIPKYCHSWFPDEEVSSFINLPFEEPEKSRIAEKAVWQTEIDAELRDIKDNN